MDYTIYPYEGVGPIKFGMTPHQVHEILGEPSDTFYKTPNSKSPTDQYDNLGCQVFYREPYFCNAIQLFEPANLFFHGNPLISFPFRELKKQFQSLDETTAIDDEGLTSYKFGVGLWAPDYCGRNDDSMVKAVIVFEKGYYDINRNSKR
jgi:hypothetical protein